REQMSALHCIKKTRIQQISYRAAVKRLAKKGEKSVYPIIYEWLDKEMRDIARRAKVVLDRTKKQTFSEEMLRFILESKGHSIF
ncbi:unnamed protein product, partial [marine sediment metagenome]